MVGVTLSGPAYVFSNNKGVINGVSITEWNINNNHPGMCYHSVCEASEKGIWRMGFIMGKHNITDYLTKILSGTAR